MKVLWITNEPLPEALSLLSGHRYVSDSTGSWVCALASYLPAACPGIELAVASPCAMVDSVTHLRGEHVRHILLPRPGRNDRCVEGIEVMWRRIRDEVAPDVVHIHGTEYPHGLAYVKACGPEHVLVTIQAVLGRYCIPEVFFGGLPVTDLLTTVTPRDIFRRDSLFAQRRRMVSRSKYETELLKSVRHVGGRTLWDRESVMEVNPALEYHYCGELLREPFHSGTWSYDSCVRGRIFVAQGYCPIKGFHQLLKALPAILESHPDVTVRVAGPAVIRGESFAERIKISGYGLFLRRIMRRHGLRDRVEFIGEIDALSMRSELLSCNVFVLPSSVENSPNSLGEAQMLGVPCVASRVGGVPDMIPDAECGVMYDFHDLPGLAEAVSSALDKSETFDGRHVRKVAADRHCPDRVVSGLVNIYDAICR